MDVMTIGHVSRKGNFGEYMYMYMYSFHFQGVAHVVWTELVVSALPIKFHRRRAEHFFAIEVRFEGEQD